MMVAHADRVRGAFCRVSGFVALLSCVNPPNGIRSARAESPGRCLTPSAERVLRETITQPAFRRVLEDALTLERVHMHDDQIELEVRDRTDHRYGITLVLPESKRGEPDGTGSRFLFYFAPAPFPLPPRTRAALVAAAAIVDRAIPDAALVQCSQAPVDDKQAEKEAPNEPGVPSTAHPQNRGQPPSEHRYPLALALTSAGLQVLVVLAAVSFGLRVVRPRVPNR